MSKYLELKAQISDLQAQAERVRRDEVQTVVTQIRRQIAEYGLTAQDLGLFVARRGRPPKKVPSPAIYQDPQSGATWNGRGKPPNWIAGKNREGFVIGV